MSSFQRTREALGNRLREMRLDAHLTGRQLAAGAGWTPSKISKIEAGNQTPSDLDLETWARLCERTNLIPELVASLRSLEQQYVEHRRMYRPGLHVRQRRIADIESQTALTQNFEPCFVPGLLQTAEYARYRFLEGDEGDVDRGVPRSTEELDAAIAARMERQQLLYRPGKKYHFVMTEAVLRYLVCPPDAMAGQLGQLVSMTTLQTIRLGVIPFGKPLSVGPLHGFYLYDDTMVVVELFTAVLNITQPEEIAAYQRTFKHLADAAVYGSDARKVLTGALNELAS
ncbi:helix-turn-helix domain-containing protein [Tenggerimyces flavus]|uniref:Helix-turn-helix transcriptional regulator n=1 Tax=Tenggerimyces flavus TaxID=1708749 RepID=A0ABV7YAT2_9ACTN|nr:helix-turn-helix transcriptional regulator [Tenggerimyces flavus]MBM7785539.1 transcriptional regulator with XRE-family HTH domain [Tenggerimyces flavus]